ncbi:MAG: MBL fold metallo-hydrolase [Vicinamibacteria bacterium]
MKGSGFWVALTGTLIQTMVSTACLATYESSLEEIRPSQAGYETVVQVRFLGVGGFLIQRGDEAVLTAPLYSNPTTEELSDVVKPNPDRIEKFHPHAPGVKAILVGHAHYDHLMDVPYVWEKTPEAIIYGNVSVKNILAGYAPGALAGDMPRIPEDRVVALDRMDQDLVDYRKCIQNQGPVGQARGRFDAATTDGAWVNVPDTNIRFRALCSEHPPQILSFIHLWPGCVHRPRFAPPDRSQDYQEGQTLAYLIDFMDDNQATPLFRIYYQDAPTRPTIGEIPEELLSEKAVDLALLCVGNFFDVRRPTHIVENTNPRYVILGHWENFFGPQDEWLKEIPFASTRRVVKAVREAAPGAEVFMPIPQTLFHFEPETSRADAKQQPPKKPGM